MHFSSAEERALADMAAIQQSPVSTLTPEGWENNSSGSLSPSSGNSLPLYLPFDGSAAVQGVHHSSLQTPQAMPGPVMTNGHANQNQIDMITEQLSNIQLNANTDPQLMNLLTMLLQERSARQQVGQGLQQMYASAPSSPMPGSMQQHLPPLSRTLGRTHTMPANFSPAVSVDSSLGLATAPRRSLSIEVPSGVSPFGFTPQPSALTSGGSAHTSGSMVMTSSDLQSLAGCYNASLEMSSMMGLSSAPAPTTLPLSGSGRSLSYNGAMAGANDLPAPALMRSFSLFAQPAAGQGRTGELLGDALNSHKLPHSTGMCFTGYLG